MGDRAEFMRKRAMVGPGGQTDHAPDRIERLSIVAQKAQALRRLREGILSKKVKVRRSRMVAMFPELSGVAKSAMIAKAVELIDQAIAAMKAAERKRRDRA